MRIDYIKEQREILIRTLKEFRKISFEDLECEHDKPCTCLMIELALKLAKSWEKTVNTFGVLYYSIKHDKWYDGVNDKYYRLMKWWEYMTFWQFKRKEDKRISIGCIYNNFPYQFVKYSEVQDLIEEFS